VIDPGRLTLDDLETDPHPILADLRDNNPVAYLPHMDMWLVTRWDEVTQVCGDPDSFTANTNPSWLAECLGENMLTLDGEQHDHLAKGMRPAFAATGSGGEIRALLPAMFDRLIDGFADLEATDLMAAYAEPMANITLIEALGLTGVDWKQMAGWCRGVITGLANFENDPAKSAMASKANHELGVALDRQIDLAMRGGSHRGLADYLRAGFGRDEIVNNVRLMISGGINEPRDGLGLVVLELLADPSLLARVTADPESVRGVIEETLRFHSPVGTATRQTTREVDLGGVPIPPGSIVAAVLASANRDPRHWTDPDRFDPDRREGRHLAFSMGEHRCLGDWMGRQQIRIGVERLLARLPGLSLSEGVVLRGFEFRGPITLRVDWGH
jgi:cytochrome P450